MEKSNTNLQQKAEDDLPHALYSLFPYSAIREGQREFYEDVKETMLKGTHLIAHAPTGIGKTAAVLAGVLEYALLNRKKVFFLTSRQTQHDIALKTLRAIEKKSGIKIACVDMIGKRDMCTHPKAMNASKDSFYKICKKIRDGKVENAYACRSEEVLFQETRFIFSEIKSAGEVKKEFEANYSESCAHCTSLLACTSANAVICDYSYIFFPPIQTAVFKRMKIDSLAECILVVDEAHNLPERIRGFMSKTLGTKIIENAWKDCEGLSGYAEGGSTHTLIRALRALHDLLLEDEMKKEREFAMGELPKLIEEQFKKKHIRLSFSDFQKLVSDTSDVRKRRKEEEIPPEEEEEKTDLLRVGEFLERWLVPDSGLPSVRFAKDNALHCKLLDVSVLAKPIFASLHSSVLMSGTLYPPETYSDILGLWKLRTKCKSYLSPFPKENRKILHYSAVTTQFKHRSELQYGRIAGALDKIISATKGNTAVFFQSYEMLMHVRACLKTKKRIMEEKVEQTREKKMCFVEELVRRKEEGAVLLAVMGGSLGEGIDYTENSLSSLAIVGIPFRPPSLEEKKMRAYCVSTLGKEKGERAMLVPAFNMVLQAAGRAIRDAGDRAVIVLMDERFSLPYYKQFLPEDFRFFRSIDNSEELAEAVKKFHQRLKG
ncbi:MAG: ATP-dependent DNA helicase [Candidatus Micrarchaeota archaeon]